MRLIIAGVVCSSLCHFPAQIKPLLAECDEYWKIGNGEPLLLVSKVRVGMKPT
jgi:hypothetical protein